MEERHGRKVLVVDDEKDFLTLVTADLKAHGYDVIAAYDGLEGLEKAEKENPDLILVDVSMPRINGFQMVQLLRLNEAFKETPILIITGTHQKSESAWCEQMGIRHWILKPFENKVLLEKIEKALHAHSA